MWLHFFPHWAVTPQKDLKLACLSTGPAIRCAVANILAELIETLDLVLGIAAIFSKHVSARVRRLVWDRIWWVPWIC